jgi:hypothetical protein
VRARPNAWLAGRDDATGQAAFFFDVGAGFGKYLVGKERNKKQEFSLAGR